MKWPFRRLMGLNPVNTRLAGQGGTSRFELTRIFFSMMRLKTEALPVPHTKCFGLKLAEYHTGYWAFHRRVLESVNLELNSDNFSFDQEIIAQIVELKMRIAEIPVPTRYFPEASSASFSQSVTYGFSVVGLLFRYMLHKTGIWHQKQFDSLGGRYTRVPHSEQG
jgi:hypothetical protein